MSSKPQKVQTYVEKEKGRWVVYLEVTFWEPNGDFPLNTVRHRVDDYRSEQRAKIAAELIRRSADRDLDSPPL